MTIEQAFRDALRIYQQTPYPSVKERKDNLIKLKKCLQHSSKDIIDAIDKDYMGRAHSETRLLELFPSIQSLKHAIRHVHRWSKARRRWIGPWLLPAKASVLPQPKGVVGFIVPWNYPLYLTISPLSNALAAGNVVMVKLSEQSEHLGEVLKQKFKSYGIDRVSIITGDVDVAKAFSQLPFDHLLYTGSGAVAKSIMKSASTNLTPVTLELGGKSPVIIGITAKRSYFERIIIGKCLNSGQTCIAPDYVFLPLDKKEIFIELAKKTFHRAYPNFKQTQDYTAVITPRHFERLNHLLEDAKAKGAEIIPLAEAQNHGKTMPLTLLFNVTEEMEILKQEIFGPLLPVMFYDHFNEVVQYIRTHDKPLAIYYFGADKNEVQILKTQTLSGSLTINETVIQIGADNLPFGGIGESGMGQYHGKEGFDTFSKLKPIFKQAKYSSFSLLYPPYGRLANYFLKLVGGIKY